MKSIRFTANAVEKSELELKSPPLAGILALSNSSSREFAAIGGLMIK